MKKIAALSLLFLALGGRVTAQTRYSGQVVADNTQTLAGVTITLTARCVDPFGSVRLFSNTARTETNGTYAVTVPVPTPGGSTCQTRTDSFTVYKPGYVFTPADGPLSSFPADGRFVGTPSLLLAVVSAASYRNDNAAPEMLAAAFGNGLAARTEAATALPLPDTGRAQPARPRPFGRGENSAAAFRFAHPSQLRDARRAG